jgi:hypothetical protein
MIPDGGVAAPVHFRYCMSYYFAIGKSWLMDEEPKDELPKEAPSKRTFVTQALGKSISKLTQISFSKRGFADGEILHRWPTIIGKMLAKASHPEKIVYPKGRNGNGTLQLRVGNSALALDIQHMEPVILDRINAHFGYRAINRIKIIQAPLPQKKENPNYKPRELTETEKKSLNQQLSTVEDTKLKKALENLGKSVTGRNDH